METIKAVSDFSGFGIELHLARHLTTEEKKNYIPECWDYIVYSVGESIRLDYLTRSDVSAVLHGRQSDIAFLGVGNLSWTITDVDWDALIALNNQRREATEAKERSQRIASLTHRKEQMEQIIAAKGKLPTKAEAEKMRREWVRVQNEGGEGYVPRYETVDEYKAVCKELAEMEARQSTPASEVTKGKG